MSVLIVYFKTHRNLVPLYMITSENASMAHDTYIISHINNMIISLVYHNTHNTGILIAINPCHLIDQIV